MKRNIYNLHLLFFILLFAFNTKAQDIHFSQLYNTSQNMNPALTGIFKGDQRFVANYRSQWQSVPVPYLTFSGSYDQKVFLKFLGDGFLGGGLVFNHDQSGDGDLSWTQLGLNISYTQPLSDELYLSSGFQAMLGGRSFKPDQLTFGEQWNGDIFDPNRSIGESFSTSSKSLNSISGGLNLHYQIKDTRTKFDVGFAMYHINQPEASFLANSRVQLPRKGNGYLLGTYQLKPKMDVRVFAWHSFQSVYNETVVGAAFRYHMSLQRSKEIAFQPGLGMRLGDAIIPSLEIQYHAFRVGFSYDINISSFNVATQRRGGPEISFEYILTKVKPVKVFKACPIF